VLIIPTHESDGTVLAHYTFTWPAEAELLPSQDLSNTSVHGSGSNTPSSKLPRQALALGLGSMFNHKRIPNVAWNRDIPLQAIQYFTLRDIEVGEELCISYGAKLWFDDTDAPELDDSIDRHESFLLKVDVFEEGGI